MTALPHGIADAVAAAWLAAHAPALHQALFDAECYRDEHGLPAEGERADFDELAAELAALAGLDLELRPRSLARDQTAG
jgi:hypothetical protein